MSRSWWQSIGIVGMLTLVSGCSGTASVTPSSSTQVSASPTNSPQPLPAPKSVWMTQFQPIDSTPYLQAPIYVAEGERKSIVSQIKSASSEEYRQDYTGLDIRNYMFVNRDSLSANKLLPNNNSRLLEIEQIGTTTAPAKSSKSIKIAKSLWYVRVLADTNGDKVLNDRDRKQIGISDVSGANYTEIIQDIDKILLLQRKGIDRRLLIYTSGSKRFVANIDIPKRLATIKQLPEIE
jgi:hypothetical protein